MVLGNAFALRALFVLPPLPFSVNPSLYISIWKRSRFSGEPSGSSLRSSTDSIAFARSREVEVEGRIHPADEDPPTGTRKEKKRRQYVLLYPARLPHRQLAPDPGNGRILHRGMIHGKLSVTAVF